MEKVDRKFQIAARCIEHGHLHTEADSVLFLVKDKAFLAALRAYRLECESIGAAALQLAGVDRLIERVDRWQAEHAAVLKVPDIDAGFESIAGPNEPREP